MNPRTRLIVMSISAPVIAFAIVGIPGHGPTCLIETWPAMVTGLVNTSVEKVSTSGRAEAWRWSVVSQPVQ